MYVCCVLEKEKPSAYQGKCKDGFHLHFPFFYTEAWVQKEYIRQEVISRVQERKILADVPMTEPLDKVFDKNIPSVPWLMYGSRKEVNAEAYKLTKCYNKDGDSIPLSTVFKKKPTQGDRIFNLPRYLSIRGDFSLTKLNDTVEKKKTVIKTKVVRTRNLDEILADLVEAQQYMDLLKDARADNYGEWMQIGWILFCIGEGIQKALDMWITFSGRSEKFEDGKCDKLWAKMEIRGYNLGSLKHLAKEDSPSEFRAIKDAHIDYILHQGISMAHNDIAKILYIMFENQYVCADIEKDIWYEFRNHRWLRIAKGIGLRRNLSYHLVNKYAKMASDYMSKINNEEDQEKRNNYNSKAQLITKLIDKLKNNSFKNAVMKEAQEYFYDDKFVERMDENASLTVFENGVYDAKLKCFRDGRPDDYSTKSTGCYYREFDENDPNVPELYAIFNKVFPSEKLFKFFKQTVSDLIMGGNRHKIFVIWTGAGDNGKSVIADLIEKGFGDYYYTPPTSLLTGKGGKADEATASLLPCKGARVVVASETDNSDILNCGTMKKLTGGDPFYARGLFKEPTKIYPHFKTILHCNKMPNVSAEDKASWNRIRVLPFESTFVKKDVAPKTEKEQFEKKTFPMDKSLKDRLNDLKETFMSWLIKQYEIIGDADLYEPPEVKAATNIYQKSNDFYMQFIDEKIKQTGNKKDIISLTVLYALFKDWYKDSYPNRKIPIRQQVKESMEKKMGNSVKGIWKGWVSFNPDEEAGDDEAVPGEEKKSSKVTSQKRLAPASQVALPVGTPRPAIADKKMSTGIKAVNNMD
jgi:P4 family phage/plasmid primase-like protien